MVGWGGVFVLWLWWGVLMVEVYFCFVGGFFLFIGWVGGFGSRG